MLTYNDCLHFVVCDRCPKCKPEDCEFYKNKTDVVEVKHGEWIETGGYDAYFQPIYQCSVCYKEVADNYISCHKYCLHCGAQMNIERKDNNG